MIAAWIAFLALVLRLLTLDLGVFHRRAHTVGMREAASLFDSPKLRFART